MFPLSPASAAAQAAFFVSCRVFLFFFFPIITPRFLSFVGLPSFFWFTRVFAARAVEFHVWKRADVPRGAGRLQRMHEFSCNGSVGGRGGRGRAAVRSATQSYDI